MQQTLTRQCKHGSKEDSSLADLKKRLFVLRRPMIGRITATFVHYVCGNLLLRRLSCVFTKELDAQHVRLITIKALIEEKREGGNRGKLAWVHTIDDAVFRTTVSELQLLLRDQSSNRVKSGYFTYIYKNFHARRGKVVCRTSNCQPLNFAHRIQWHEKQKLLVVIAANGQRIVACARIKHAPSFVGGVLAVPHLQSSQIDSFVERCADAKDTFTGDLVSKMIVQRSSLPAVARHWTLLCLRDYAENKNNGYIVLLINFLVHGAFLNNYVYASSNAVLINHRARKQRELEKEGEGMGHSVQDTLREKALSF